MSTEVRIVGRIRDVLEAIGLIATGDAEQQAVLTGQRELLVAQGTSQYGEVVRPGRAFYTGTTTAIAAVIAVPTTAHLVAIYNMDNDGGRTLVIDWVAASGVAKTAAAGQAQLLVLPGQVREAAPADGALVIKKANGNGPGADSKARTVLNATAIPAATGIAGNWVPLGPSVGFPGAAATPGHGLYARVDGAFEVPPGRWFAMHVLADVVGSTFQGFIGWHEKVLNLG